MKALVLQVFHEAHAFLPHSVGVADFRRRHWLQGEAARRTLGTDNWAGGVRRALDDAGVDTAWGLCTACLPGGALRAADYALIRAELLSSVQAAQRARGDFDLVVLLLHGALAVAGHADPESDLAAAVRASVGTQARLGIALDFHCNPGAGLLRAADVVVAGRDYPHTDVAERGAKLVRLLLRQPARRTRYVRLPIAVPMNGQQTVDGPFARLRNSALALEAELGLDDLAMVGGFPYAAHDRVGAGIFVTGPVAACAAAVRALALEVWELAPQLLVPPPGVSDVRDWLARPARGSGTLVIADAGDNPGAGGAGNDGVLLAVVLQSPSPSRFAAGIHVDPALALAAQAAGVGGVVPLRLQTSGPAPAQALGQWPARVERTGALRYVNAGPMLRGEVVDGGLGAVLAVQGAGGARGHVLVGSERIQPYDAQAFLSQGVALTGLDVVLLKSSAHFRAAYQPWATHEPGPALRVADGGGWASADWRRWPCPEGRPRLPWSDVSPLAWLDTLDRALVLAGLA